MYKTILISLISIANILFAHGQNQSPIPQQEIQKIINKKAENKNIFGTVVTINKGSETVSFSAGNMENQDQYFIASITKLYTSAIIFKLKDDGKLKLDDKISKYLSSDIMNGIHIYKGIDYSNEITIRHLLSNTSGLPDYFAQKQPNGQSLINELIKGNDEILSFEEIIKISKSMEPKFQPGKQGKAFYSDVNFQILGKIIIVISDMSISDAYENFILKPLGLTKTYLYNNISDTIPSDIYYKTKKISIPKIMSSVTSDGGIVSTAEENMIFLKAFFNGQLFSIENFKEMKTWNRIHFPFKYGMSIARFKLYNTPEIIGHPGASGSFAYYIPKKDIYITGTINQIDNQILPYKLIFSILDKL